MNLFNPWNIKKQLINKKNHFVKIKEGEIWWCSLGYNIGSEVYGKGKGFLRPVLVINAESDDMFIGIPLSSKLYFSKYNKLLTTDDLVKHKLMFYQVRSFDKKRLLKKNLLRKLKKK